MMLIMKINLLIVHSGNMKKIKKEQMKIQQMAFMLIAVTFFFVIAGLFFLMIGFSNIKQSAAVLQEQNALLLVSKIADSPEFSCENAFGQARTNCVDEDKIMALKGRIQEYSKFWGDGVNGIEILKTYPVPGSGIECTSENYPDCNQMTLVPFTNGTGIANFVSLCRKAYDNRVYDKCELGEVVVVYNG